MRKYQAALGAAALMFSVAACSSSDTAGSDSVASGDKKITFGAFAFDEVIASTYLWEAILEDQGYDVDVKMLDVAPTYVGVANGQLDASMAMSPVFQKDYWDQNEDKFEAVNAWYEGVSQAVAVPESLGITSMDELADHADELGNQIIGIEAGSGLMGDLHEDAVDAYGLQDFKIVDGSTPAMLAALEKATTEDKPIAATLWQPHWALSKYPYRILEDPKGVFGGEDKLRSIVSKDFAEEHPDVVEQMSKFKMTPEQLQSLELAITEAGGGNESEAVQGWIKDNQAAVDEWTAS